MSDDVFSSLAEQLNALPSEIETAYEEATVETIDKKAEMLRQKLLSTSGSKTLNSAMAPIKVYKKGVYYERGYDWDDRRIVNVDQGKGYGKYKEKTRKQGKRNFSIHPATYHDLAYIINHGHGGQLGNNFIDRSMRSVRNWKIDRDVDFERRLSLIGKKFTEE